MATQINPLKQQLDLITLHASGTTNVKTSSRFNLALGASSDAIFGSAQAIAGLMMYDLYDIEVILTSQIVQA
jgi:hypothetical protein